MYIRSKPTGDEDVPIEVNVVGKCTHAAANGNDEATVNHLLPNRRKLRGAERKEITDTLHNRGKSATEVHYEILGRMNKEECVAGNTTACQTPQILRQAAYESRKQYNLHDDVVTELEVQRVTLVAALPGRKLSGYIKNVAYYPFCVAMYCERQIEAYIRFCKENPSSTVHIDATGSVIRNIPHQSAPFYYSVVISDNSMPVLDFFLTDNKSSSIQNVINAFNSNVRLVNNGRDIKPCYVVTDHSMALMNATLRCFNCYTLPTYLARCYAVLTGALSSVEIRQTTYLVLCAAHVTKTVADALSKAEPDKKKRRQLLVYFTALRRSTDLTTAKELYQLIHVVSNNKRNTAAVRAAKSRLLQLCTGECASTTCSVEGKTTFFAQRIVIVMNICKCMLQQCHSIVAFVNVNCYV